MVTRRAMLKGTAAGSIAAIASAHGVAASAAPPGPIPVPYPNGVGYGSLASGALAGFVKLRDSYSMFLKWHSTGAELFYKEDATAGAIDVFIKFFDKARGWGSFQKIDTIGQMTLQGADAGFYKVQADSATIFLKVEGEEVDSRDIFANGDGCNVGCEGGIG